MNDLDTLRASLTSAQRDLLSKIWVYYLKEGHWIPTRVLHSTVKGGKQVARPLLERLGGKVVYEQDENGIPQYAVTLLGVMLSSEGDRVEELLTSYMRLARQLALQEPTRTNVTSREFGERFGLTSEELTLLGRVLTISTSQFTGGYSWSFERGDQWDAVLPRDIEDWPDDPRPFVCEAALRDYGPSVPLSPNERAAYYANKKHQDIIQEQSGSQSAKPPEDLRPMTKTLWLTYAWLDNKEGDFDYLVGQLAAAGISTRYDKIAIVPGRHLWEQIADQITKGDLAGWAYLLTPQSIASQACREELAYALDRALKTRGQDFPLLGLLHQVPISDVPAPLRVRLCVDLRSTDWVEEIRAGLEGRPPLRTIPETTNIKGRVHNAYLGNQNLRAVEFTPRFGEMHYWRIAYPSTAPEPVMKGTGPAGGGGVDTVLYSVVEGTVDIKGVPMKFFGAGNALTPSTSAYIVFEHDFPTSLAFGCSTEPYGVPSLWQPVEIR